MRLEYSGVEFDCSYHGGSAGGPCEAPYGAEVETTGAHVSDWDELAACHGLKSGDYIPCVSLADLIDKIAERNADRMIEDAEQEMADDFDPPDDDDSDWDYGGP